jgi:tetratricopeptide (TPR) repeat protein
MKSRTHRRAASSAARAIFLAVLVRCGAGLSHAQFAPEDEVRLRRDEPLLFKDAVYRQGKIGEVFKVLKYDRAAGSVFLLANDADGKPFALRCPDSAIEPAPKDTWALLREGLNAMQQGELEYARTRFVRASTGNEVNDVALRLALHCETLRRAAADVAAAREAQRKAQTEIGRLTRNAQVADRPSLIPNDTSNQVRAGEIRAKAAALNERSELGVTNAMEALVRATESAREHAKSLMASGSYSLGVPMWDAIAAFARRNAPASEVVTQFDLPDRVEMARRTNAASDALARARQNLDAKKLVAALGALENGLASEPGRDDLKQFRVVVEAALERARARVQTARSLASQQRRDEALEELAKAEAICADDPEAVALRKELRATAEKRPGAAP